MRRNPVLLPSLLFVSFPLHSFTVLARYHHSAFLPLLLHVFADFIHSNCIVLLRN
ncbi:hypothetical protein EDD22DRAFT_865825 [Suillus occidentalis]|nr:hypothetical protein EDD22DRAFT_865825 [Suillus occidentalis]